MVEDHKDMEQHLQPLEAQHDTFQQLMPTATFHTWTYVQDHVELTKRAHGDGYNIEKLNKERKDMQKHQTNDGLLQYVNSYAIVLDNWYAKTQANCRANQAGGQYGGARSGGRG